MKGRRRIKSTKFCPECGGDLEYYPGGANPFYVCSSCGLQLTPQELQEKRRWQDYRDKEEKREDRIREYVDWWLSKK